MATSTNLSLELIVTGAEAGTWGVTTNDNWEIVDALFHTDSAAASPVVDTLRSVGTVYIGDTANTNQTLGLTINQGAATNEILTFQQSSVNHLLVTGYTETDTYGYFQQYATTGGLSMRAFKAFDATDSTLELIAFGGAGQNTKATTTKGLIDLVAIAHNGADAIGNVGPDVAIVSMRARVGGSNLARWLLDEDGDTWQTGDVTAVNGTFSGNVSGTLTTAAQTNITSLGTLTSLAVTNNITVSGTVDGRDVAADGTKLDGIEALADVTDTANVTAAGALMDSEVDADIKTLVLPASTTISAFGATLIDDAAASNARTTLGVDAAGTDNSTDVTLAGTPDYITLAGQVLTRNQIVLTTDVSGVLPIANMATGTPDGTKFVRDDGTLAVPSTGAAAAGSLTGTTLAANVVTSSLTSVGTLTGLTVTGNITLSGSNRLLTTTASSTSTAGLRVPHGTAPSAPTNGDVWTTSAGGLLARINGTSRTFASLTSTQTLTNKTLTSPTITGPTVSGTITGTPTWASSQAITLSTAAQPNITSVGSLTSVTTTGNANVGGQLYSPLNAIGNSGTSFTANLNNANIQSVTNTGAATVTLSNPQSGGSYGLVITAGAGANSNWTWPAAVKWNNGVEPSLSTTLNRVDVVTLIYDGTSYYGAATQDHQ